MKVAKQNIGNAGEYYIAYLLSASNCIVTVTLGRAEGFDLLIGYLIIGLFLQKWLETPKRDGTPHKDSTIRKFYLVNHKNYPPNWETTLEQYKNNIDPILS